MQIRFMAHQYTGLLIFTLFIHLPVAGASESQWRFRNRIQLGIEWDTNFREAQTGEQAATAGRLLVQSRGEKRGRGYLFCYSGTSGYQRYPSGIREDKLMHEGKVHFDVHLFKRIYAGIESWGRYKNFIYDPIDYYLISGTAIIRVRLGWNMNVGFSVRPQRLNYAVNDYYDYIGRETGIMLMKKFSRKFSLEFEWVQHYLEFDRTALQELQPFSEPLVFSVAQKSN